MQSEMNTRVIKLLQFRHIFLVDANIAEFSRTILHEFVCRKDVSESYDHFVAIDEFDSDPLVHVFDAGWEIVPFLLFWRASPGWKVGVRAGAYAW